jgi:hypothetical protein
LVLGLVLTFATEAQAGTILDFENLHGMTAMAYTPGAPVPAEALLTSLQFATLIAQDARHAQTYSGTWQFSTHAALVEVNGRTALAPIASDGTLATTGTIAFEWIFASSIGNPVRFDLLPSPSGPTTDVILDAIYCGHVQLSVTGIPEITEQQYEDFGAWNATFSTLEISGTNLLVDTLSFDLVVLLPEPAIALLLAFPLCILGRRRRCLDR